MQDPRLSKTQIHNHDSQAQSAKRPNWHTQDPRANHVEFQLYSTGIVHHQTSSHRHHKPLHFVTRFTTCHKQRMPIVHHASYLLRCKLSSSLASVGRCRLAPADGKLTFGFICMFIKCMIDDRQWIDFLVHYFQTDEIWVLCWFCCINWFNFVIKKPRKFQKT